MIFLCVYSNDGVFGVALQVHVQAYSNGRVTWTPPALYRSSCGVKVNSDKHFINFFFDFFVDFLSLTGFFLLINV